MFVCGEIDHCLCDELCLRFLGIDHVDSASNCVRVHTTDVDAGLGLITCERCQTAILVAEWGESPDSSHKQCCRCGRRWRGTNDGNGPGTSRSGRWNIL